jgi:hypothetical protein
MRPATATLLLVLGEEEAVVREVDPIAIHGLPYVDVMLVFPDGTTDRPRLGPEAVPEGLEPGERVLVTRAARVVIAIRRP